MANIESIAAFLNRIAPPELAESWDNVGLLVGDPNKAAARVMTCLTVTGATVAEATHKQADLVVTHHPLPFRPIQRITAETPEGRYLLELIGAGVAIYSAHTAFDSTSGGINERLAEGLGLGKTAPLVAKDEIDSTIGSGRYGEFSAATTLAELADRLKGFLSIDTVRAVGDPQRTVQRVAFACGSAGELLDAARDVDCDVFVTGETSFHTCLAAEAHDVALLLTGHFASEQFAMECLADLLATEFQDLEVWASQSETDPLQLL
jgi:dinuclear metal center YbgI/SA1388 family protein